MSEGSRYEDVCTQVRACTRRLQLGLCPCSDENCCQRGTRALAKMCQFTREEVKIEYDLVQKSYSTIIQEEDSPSFDEFLEVILRCTPLFLCSNACTCSCHFGRLENFSDIPEAFAKPSLFSLLASRQMGVPIGSKIDPSEAKDEECFTFGGQIVDMGGSKMPLRDAVHFFREQSEGTRAYATSSAELLRLIENAKDHTFSYFEEEDTDDEMTCSSTPNTFWSRRLGRYESACDCPVNIELYHKAPDELLDAHAIDRRIKDDDYFDNKDDSLYIYCLLCRKPYHKACHGEHEPFFCRECRRTEVLTTDIVMDLNDEANAEDLNEKEWRYYHADLKLVAFPSLATKLLIASFVPESLCLSLLLVDDDDGSQRTFPCPMAYFNPRKSPMSPDCSLRDAMASLYLSVCIQHRDDVHDHNLLATRQYQRDASPIQTVEDWISTFGQNPQRDERFYRENNAQLRKKIDHQLRLTSQTPY